MPGMPEIIGDSQVSALEPAEEMAERVERSSIRSFPKVDRRAADPGIFVSPLRLIRLEDFSGEGERAPPAHLLLGTR